MKKILFALAALMLAFPLAAQQFDYTLAPISFQGFAVPSPVLHIQTVSWTGSTYTVTALVYPSLGAYQTSGFSLPGQWAFPSTSSLTMAQVWSNLQGMSGLQLANNDPISFAGAVPLAAPPVLSLPAGNYPTATSLTITDSTPGAAIYYTLDGTQPTTSSTAYTAPFLVGGQNGETVKAIAVASGYTQSLNASAAYQGVVNQ